ncbi:pentalenene synthase [Pseudozyma hubeiensis SY62]|uniref:Pentalenene synthase n=1 Tax=Pseudozyma hubeiensis (strain SY62) TaxID=1305764 RepID=R9PIC8_PSEHS|nr:pentalenene synthase [Pseudozyma hubeiensis SY62]GAC97825.1 pentalenene synthase [Pseudozyma hubeiensis SY62]
MNCRPRWRLGYNKVHIDTCRSRKHLGSKQEKLVRDKGVRVVTILHCQAFDGMRAPDREGASAAVDGTLNGVQSIASFAPLRLTSNCSRPAFGRTGYRTQKLHFITLPCPVTSTLARLIGPTPTHPKAPSLSSKLPLRILANVALKNGHVFAVEE